MRRTLGDLDVAGRRVLVRVDFNVPLAPDGAVLDDTRIRATLPTIAALRGAGARVILVSHLGRPEGQRVPTYSLKPVAEQLARLIGAPVAFAEDCVGESARRAVSGLRDGDVALLENVRYYAGEEANDPAFARDLAALAERYVNDAFGTAHRAHASTAGVAALLPSAAGLLLEREIAALTAALDRPRRPFVAIVGGSKISTKIGVLGNLLPRVDTLLIGGAMAFTMLKARGAAVGGSFVEDDQLDVARAILSDGGSKIILPVDAVGAERLVAGVATSIVDADKVPDEIAGLDIGPRTIARWTHVLRAAGTVLWNGPLGAYEVPPFDAGTRAVAQVLATTQATTVIGGGDLVAAVEAAGVSSQMSHVSTGGGAALEFIEGRALPGIAALEVN
ncbi:MAG: phosphoglycerate kinase [Chloroflexota bacterium]|nr:MAG: phosphoglycerate kinase [Chloroflexota bacterium]